MTEQLPNIRYIDVLVPGPGQEIQQEIRHRMQQIFTDFRLAGVDDLLKAQIASGKTVGPWWKQLYLDPDPAKRPVQVGFNGHRRRLTKPLGEQNFSLVVSEPIQYLSPARAQQAFEEARDNDMPPFAADAHAILQLPQEQRQEAIDQTIKDYTTEQWTAQVVWKNDESHGDQLLIRYKPLDAPDEQAQEVPWRVGAEKEVTNSVPASVLIAFAKQIENNQAGQQLTQSIRQAYNNIYV